MNRATLLDVVARKLVALGPGGFPDDGEARDAASDLRQVLEREGARELGLVLELEREMTALRGASDLERDAGCSRVGVLVERLQDALTDVPPSPANEAQPEAAGAPRDPPEGFSVKDPEIALEFAVQTLEHLESAETHLLSLESDPGNQGAIDKIFRCVHTIKGVAGYLSLPELERVAHATEDLLDAARTGSLSLDAERAELILESIDLLRDQMKALCSALTARRAVPSEPRAAALAARLTAVARAGAAVPAPKRDGPREGARPVVAAARAEHALVHPAAPPRSGPSVQVEVPRQGDWAALPERRDPSFREPIRVDAARLERVLDGVRELVSTGALLSEALAAAGMGASEIARHANRLRQIADDLRSGASSLRTVPLSPTFHRMDRLARDVSRRAGKDVTLRLVGEETELDKSVVDRLGEPLMHLLRNAIDHGIERAEDRERAGKPRRGRVELRAVTRDGQVCIEVEDDGRGIDRGAVLARAVERGLVPPDAQLSDDEIHALVCAPGFSTRTAVTVLSGRGVGLDIVRRTTEAMGGKLEITSNGRAGACFSLSLPATLSVVDAVVLQVGDERVALPTRAATRLVRPRPEDVVRGPGGESLRLGDRLLPLVRLREVLREGGGDIARSLVVVCEEGPAPVAFLADDLLGQKEVRRVGDAPSLHAGFSEGALLTDGARCLLLDVVRMAHFALARATPSLPASAAADLH